MRKGFTLIELLAVIVILAIIALIATPIVLNIIEESRENANLRSAEMYLDAVEMSIATSTLNNKKIKYGTYNILESGNICLEYTDDNCTDELKVEVDGELPSIGSTITVTNGKIENINLKYNNKTISMNNENQLIYKTTPCKYTTDEDGYEMVTCGTESFYIMEETEDNIIMLAKYNLNVGDNSYPNGTIGIQNKNLVGKSGTVSFSTTNYWWDLPPYGTVSYGYVYDSNSNLYVYVETYEDYLKETLKVSSASAAIMSYDQAESLLCGANGEYNCILSPKWVYSTSYWTGGVDAGDWIWYVASDGTFDYCDYTNYKGVRPVVTISTSEVQ